MCNLLHRRHVGYGIDKGFCLFAMQISSNMAKISLSFESDGICCTSPIMLSKGWTIRQVMEGGGGGDFLRGNISFLYTYRSNIFFFSLDGWKFFLSEIYRPIFQAREFFFALCLGRFFAPPPTLF